MKIRLISLLVIISISACCFFGCTAEEKTENKDSAIINNSVFKLGLLLDDDSSSDLTEKGFEYANSLANKVNINEIVEIETHVEKFTSADDVESKSDMLINSGISAVVMNIKDEDSFNKACDIFKNENIAVISLSPYEYESDNFNKLSLSSEYITSCALSYAKEKNYSETALLLESDNDFYKSFAETYTNTHKSYLGTEPTVYYMSGNSKNYTPDALCGGSYSSVFIYNINNEENAVSELRKSGYTGEIILPECFDKNNYKSEIYNNCSVISKTEYDTANNISTVFYNSFSELNNLSTDDISASVAYGYDSYMVIFEALKSFSTNENNSIFKNNTEETTKAEETKEILSSDFIKALSEVTYFGVTDTITFNNSKSIPTYIYVDYILNSQVFTGNKYIFNN